MNIPMPRLLRCVNERRQPIGSGSDILATFLGLVI